VRSGRRVAAVAVVSLTGLAPLAPAAVSATRPGTPIAGWLLIAFGLLLGLALIGAGYVLYGSPFPTRQVVRIAGWNVLGVVVLAAVMGLVFAYQGAKGTPMSDPALSGGVVVGVSAVAHLLIGIRDAQRIRLEELSREREKLTVLNRLVRHNLRNDTQVILLQADYLDMALDDPNHKDAATVIRETAETIGSMSETVKDLQAIVEGGPSPRRAVELAPMIDNIVEWFRVEYPEADVHADVPDGLAVAADDNLRTAIEELVENGIVHAETDGPSVHIEATATGGRVTLTVSDDGPGIPQREREIVTGDRTITQLDHGSGLGLWLAKWIVEDYDGELGFEDADEGTTVALRLDRASG